MTWKVTRRNVWKDIANLQKRKNDSTFSKSQHHAWMTINPKKKKWVSKRILSTVCSQFVLKCLYLVRIGRFDVICSVNKLARAATKWTKSCEKRLARLISCIHQTSEYQQYCCGKHSTTMQIEIVSRLWFPGDLELELKTRNQHQDSVHFGSHTFVPTCWMCKKQTSVSHSSTEVEIISLDAGSRMDGIPALTLWDLVIEVFHSVPNRTDGPKREPRWNPSAVVKPNIQNTIPIKHTNVIPTNIDHFPSHATHSGPISMLLCVWGQWSNNQNDYQRSKSHKEACFTIPQSCSGLVVWHD